MDHGREARMAMGQERWRRALDPPAEFFDVGGTAAFAVAQAYRALRGYLGPERRELGLDEGRDLVLLEVGRQEGRATAASVRARLAMSRGSVSTVLRRAEEAGYVRRVRDGENRRVIRLSLTGEGRAAAIGAAVLWRDADVALGAELWETDVEWLRRLATAARGRWLSARAEEEAAGDATGVEAEGGRG
jgi:DNA-binding MarR family transcriptional regulator